MGYSVAEFALVVPTRCYPVAEEYVAYGLPCCGIMFLGYFYPVVREFFRAVTQIRIAYVVARLRNDRAIYPGWLPRLLLTGSKGLTSVIVTRKRKD